jgi:hypothetical protein
MLAAAPMALFCGLTDHPLALEMAGSRLAD